MKTPASLLVSALPTCFALLNVAAADFDIRLEGEFRTIVPPDARVEKLAGGMGFIEGPVWVSAQGGLLVFSDIPGNELKKWTATEGVTRFRTYRAPSHRPIRNAHTDPIVSPTVE